jgi:hypothetical protein
LAKLENDDVLPDLFGSKALKVILQVGGISGIIALLLAWELAAGVRKDTTMAVALMQQHMTETKDEGAELQMIRNLLLQTCINNAEQDSRKRDGCFDAQIRTPAR